MLEETKGVKTRQGRVVVAWCGEVQGEDERSADAPAAGEGVDEFVEDEDGEDGDEPAEDVGCCY